MENSEVSSSKLNWPEMYQAGFEVQRNEPSVVVVRAVEAVGVDTLDGVEALDIGCGRLRNSVFLAENGARVTAVDVDEPTESLGELSEAVKGRITFNQTAAQDYEFTEHSHDVVVCTRVLQYLNPEDAANLTKRLVASVRPAGYLALNYTLAGGMVGDATAPTQTFSHSLGMVMSHVEGAGMMPVHFNVASYQPTAHVPGFVPNDNERISCDLVAYKPSML